MKIGSSLWAILALCGCAALLPAPTVAQQGAVLSSLPDRIDSAGRYVFYLHGRIIEEAGRRPTHPRFGVYEYDEILQELARTGATVVSEQRARGTVVRDAARGTAGQVRKLLDAGVDPKHVVVVGFSKGGWIAVHTSDLLDAPIRYVFLAACGPGILGDEGLQVRGSVLSIFEESDPIGVSCGPLLARSPQLGEKREVEIRTGLGHGAFYRPIAEWVDPVRTWILGDSGTP